MFATELIIDKLKELSGFKNCVIVTQDGLSIDSQLDSDIDKNFISAITFSIFSEIEKQSNRIGRKNPKTSVMETDTGILAITSMPPIDGESFIIFTEFAHGSDSIHVMDSINKISSAEFN